MTTNIMLAVSGNWFGVAWYWYALVAVALVLQSGFVLIRERQVGIVIKRFAAKSLPPGHLLALEGEAGYQADTLARGNFQEPVQAAQFLGNIAIIGRQLLGDLPRDEMIRICLLQTFQRGLGGGAVITG